MFFSYADAMSITIFEERFKKSCISIQMDKDCSRGVYSALSGDLWKCYDRICLLPENEKEKIEKSEEKNRIIQSSLYAP